MLDSRLIEFHLSKIQKQVGEESTLANTYFRLVKPIEENLKVYSKLEKQSTHAFLMSLLSALIKISLEILKSFAVAIIRFRESSSVKFPIDSQIKRIFVSHYTHAQNPSEPDIFFDQLPRENDLIFYHNNTLLNRNKIQDSFTGNKFRQRIFVTTKSLGVGDTFRLQASNLKIAIKLLKSAINSKRYTRLEQLILVYASSAQVSRQTVANQVNLKHLDSLLKANHPESLIITLEGHAYEALYIDLIHSKYSNTRLMAFQHAPIVPEQFGLMRNLLRINSSDIVLSSGEITKEYFESLNLRASVKLLGSPKWQPVVLEQKVNSPLTILGAAEGTPESLENFASLFMKLNEMNLNLKLILRVHPALSIKESSKILSQVSFGNQLILSNRPLKEDLKASNFCIYRSSAVAIEGLGYGVYPLYFNPTGDQGLNPLYFAKFEIPVFRNVSELQELFKNLLSSRLTSFVEHHEELLKISAAYYGKLDPRALD